MSEPTSYFGRITEKVLINVISGVVLALLGFIAALISPPLRNWLLGDVVVPGWGIATMGIITVVAVLVAPLRRNPPPAAVQPTAIETDAPPQFSPTALQEKCVAVLRNFDDEWVPIKDFEGIITDEARADIRQALQELVDNGWAKDRMSSTQGFSYCLYGPGLVFARLRSFPTRQKGRSP